jgi:energy-coupling factor transport system permease protein
MKNIIIGQYVPGTSFLYRMDPRSKILSLMILMVTAFVIRDLIQYGVMLLLVFTILKLGGIPIGRVLKGLKPIFVLLMFTFTFQILFVEGETPLTEEPITLTLTWINLGIMSVIILFWYFVRKMIPFRILFTLLTIAGILTLLYFYAPGTVISSSDIVIYPEGVEGAFKIMIRLVIIVTMSTILTLTTKPTDLNLGLEKIMKPFNYIGLNAEELAMIISIALRYIPTLIDEANKIMLAQASRGVDFNEGKFKDKVMQIVSLLVPMFIISFKRSDDLANAMEARNFIPGKMRTRIHVLTWQSNDTITIIFSLLLLVAAIVLRIYGPFS